MRILLAWRGQFLGGKGGMEHVCSNMANEMVHRGHDVGIMYCAEKEGIPYYSVNPIVRLFNIADPSKDQKRQYRPFWVHMVGEILRIYDRSAMQRWIGVRKDSFFKDTVCRLVTEYDPDIIVCFDPKTTTLLRRSIGRPVSIPIITMFHFPPEAVMKYSSKEERQAVTESDFVQVLTQSATQELKNILPEANIICIPNVVPQYTRYADLAKSKPRYRIINIARLNRDQKRQHLLISSFAQLAESFPEWDVVFWGKGREDYTEQLKKEIVKHKLKGRIFLMGTTHEVEKEYLNSDICGFPSAYEGFPLAMTEAMSAGLPVIAYRSCPAVNEIIEDGENGFLAEDGVESFAGGLRKLMENQELRMRMGQNAHEAMKQYASEKIWNQWEELLNQVVSGTQKNQ